MLGVILIALGSGGDEMSGTILKWSAARGKATIYALACLQYFSALVLFVGAVIWRPPSFVFVLASLPTFLIRVVLEIFQAHISLVALTKADRSTFSFIRITTIPLLLLIDIVLGYTLSITQIVGLSVIALTMLAISLGHDFNKKGLALTLFSAINAVITISLYKYNISHFNSVVAEQSIIIAILFSYFFVFSKIKTGKNPLQLLSKPLFIGLSASASIAVILESFAYSLAPASVILAAKRSSAILWSTIMGHKVFAEKHFGKKLIMVVLVTIGLVLLTKS